MDYCLLEDAFKNTPDISNTNVGCTDNVGSSKQQKYEKKKKQRTKDCFNPQPAVSTASDGKSYSEAFQNVNVPVKINIPNSLPTNKLPSYFLGSSDDDNTGASVEGFVGDFDKGKVEMGFEKASGDSNSKHLPLPSLEDNWKPLTPATNNTAYFSSLPTPGGTYPIWNTLNYEPRDVNNSISTNDNSHTLKTKIDELMKRLDALEKEYNTPHLNNQQEIIAFVGTGVFMIFTLSLLRC